jgi:hypothetical protein
MKSWVVVALVGCGAATSPIASPPPVPTPLAPAPVETEVRDPHSVVAAAPASPATGVHQTPIRWALPPALDLQEPNVDDYGRWPLTIAEHPALEPHFDIAAALADSGITWTELCTRGAQHRHLAASQELVDYLGAWCDVAHREFESAVAKLGGVRRSTARGLARAVTFDVAAIAAAHGDAHDLEGFLRRGGFLTLEEVDLIAAAYFEIGRLADATEANKLATLMDYAPTETARCTRILRAIADAEGSEREELVANLSRAAHPKDDQHVPRCTHEEAVVLCWRDHDCVNYWNLDSATTNAALVSRLTSIRKSWSEITSTGANWHRYVNLLVDSGPPRDKYALLLPAADLAVRGSDCNDAILASLHVDLDRAERILAPTITGPASLEREIHDFEKRALSDAERATLRTRLHRINNDALALAKLVPDRKACLAAIAALPPMAP